MSNNNLAHALIHSHPRLRLTVGRNPTTFFDDAVPFIHFEYGIPYPNLGFGDNPDRFGDKPDMQNRFFEESPWEFTSGRLSSDARSAFCEVFGEYYADALEKAFGWGLNPEHINSLMSCDEELGYDSILKDCIVITLSLPLNFVDKTYENLPREKVLEFFEPLAQAICELDMKDNFERIIGKVDEKIPAYYSMDENQLVHMFYQRMNVL